MYMLGFLIVFGCTLIMCLAIIVIEWIIAYAGAGLFSIVLIIVATTFLLGNGVSEDE